MGLGLLCLPVDQDHDVLALAVGLLKNRMKLVSLATVKCDACMLELYPGNLKKTQPGEYEVSTKTGDDQLQDVWIRGQVLGALKAKRQALMDNVSEQMADEMEMTNDETLEACSNAPNGVIHVLVKQEAPKPERQKLEDVEWQQEPASSLGNCDTVSRIAVVTRLHDIHKHPFGRAKLGSGGQWEIPQYAHNIQGLDKSAVGAHYIRQSRVFYLIDRCAPVIQSDMRLAKAICSLEICIQDERDPTDEIVDPMGIRTHRAPTVPDQHALLYQQDARLAQCAAVANTADQWMSITQTPWQSASVIIKAN